MFLLSSHLIYFFSVLQLVWRLGFWDVEALLRSPLPLNIICGEPLKSDFMDKNLMDAHVDQPCEKSLWISTCTWRIAVKAELLCLVEVSGSCWCTVVLSDGTVGWKTPWCISQCLITFITRTVWAKQTNLMWRISQMWAEWVCFCVEGIMLNTSHLLSESRPLKSDSDKRCCCWYDVSVTNPHQDNLY